MSRQTKNEIVEILKERCKEGRNPLKKKQIARKVGLHHRNAGDHLKELVQDNKIASDTRDGSNTKWYYYPDYKFLQFREWESELDRAIEKSIQKFQDTFLINPDIEQVAVDIGKDPENEVFRAAFYRIWGEDNRIELGDREGKKQELEQIVRWAIILDHDRLKSGSLPSNGTEKRKDAEEYLEDNQELIDRIEFQGQKWDKNRQGEDEFYIIEEENKEKATILSAKLPEPLSGHLGKNEFKFYTAIMPESGGPYSEKELRAREI